MKKAVIQNDKQITVRELAKQFGCDIHTVTNHANRLFPGRIRNGVKTYFDEKEVTLILDSITDPAIYILTYSKNDSMIERWKRKTVGN